MDHFNPNTRQVKDVDQNVVMTLDSVFKGSPVEEVVDISQESAQEYYEKNEVKCKKAINIVYLSTARNSTTSQWPKYFHRSDFNEEYNDMVTVLAWVKGLNDSHYFQNSMCYYMNIIRKGDAKIDWGEQISDALCAQLKEVKVTLKLYMTSYLLYAAASMKQYPGLSTKGDRRLVPVREYYDQLTIKNQGSHFRRVNDAFFDVWKCMFDKILQKKRLSEVAYNRVSHFRCVFLQFPTFTYI